MKKFILLFIILLIATMLFSQERIEERGFYLGIGGGFPLMFYREPRNSMLDDLENTGATRTSFEFDVTFGNALSDKIYLVFSSSNYFDLFDKPDYTGVGFMTTIYALGVRFYPFTTGLVLGGGLGRTVVFIDEFTNGGDTVDKDREFDYGGNIIIAYDFDRTKTGFALQLGLKFVIFSVDAGQVWGGTCLFGSIVWKEREKQ